MDWIAYQKAIRDKQPRKWTPRQCTLDAFERALDGKLYDHITAAFSQEFKSGYSDERLSLDERRASIAYRLPLIIARGFVNQLFGKGHRPKPFVRNDDVTNAWISAFIDDTNLWWHLYHAAFRGQVGSAVLVLRVLAKETQQSSDAHAAGSAKTPGRFYLEVWPAAQCQPVFSRWAPDELERLTRTYIVNADSLRAEGYDVDALEKKWRDKRYGRTASSRRLAAQARAETITPSTDWVLRVTLDEHAEQWREPIPRWLYDSDDFDEATEWAGDPKRSTDHNLGETPALWIQNLPAADDAFPDGMCSFEPAINFQFRIDRTLSQTGRALDYAGDPQLAIRKGNENTGGGLDDATEDAPGGTSSDVVDVEAGGDAKFIEIRAEGLKMAVDVYVDKLDKLARRLCAASAVDHEAKVGELSGAAMRMLNDAQIGVLGIMQLAYGEGGLIRLLRLGMRMHAQVKVALPSFDAKLREILTARARSEAAAKAVADAAAQSAQNAVNAAPSESPDTGGEPVPPAPVAPATPVVDDAAIVLPRNAKPNPNAPIECAWPEPYPATGTEKQAEVSAAIAARDGKGISSETMVSSISPLFNVQNPDQEHDTIQREALANEQRELAMVAQSAQIKATYDVEPDI